MHCQCQCCFCFSHLRLAFIGTSLGCRPVLSRSAGIVNLMVCGFCSAAAEVFDTLRAPAIALASAAGRN